MTIKVFINLYVRHNTKYKGVNVLLNSMIYHIFNKENKLENNV